MRYLVGILFAFAVLDCTRVQQPQPRRAQLDSVKAVRLGLAALPAYVADENLIVAEFTRDTEGVDIIFVPADRRTRGGGGRVRVNADGTAKVLYLRQ